MLKIEVPGRERWDEKNQLFQYDKPVTLRLEHSLVSLSKWESKWNVPFYADQPEKTEEQMRDYIRCMTVDTNVDPEVYRRLTRKELNAIYTYMNAPMTATWFRGEAKPGEKNQNGSKKPPMQRRGGKVLTAEVLYARMFAAGIPKECEKWHLNRLMTLIRVCQEEQAPPKKMSRKDVLARQREINRQRRGNAKNNRVPPEGGL